MFIGYTRRGTEIHVIPSKDTRLFHVVEQDTPHTKYEDLRAIASFYSEKKCIIIAKKYVIQPSWISRICKMVHG